MTIRVTVTNTDLRPECNLAVYNVPVQPSADVRLDVLASLLGKVGPGETKEFYVWSTNALLIKEV
jgi:hypothetical protein